MSVLQFISSIKWPITVLLLSGWISWRAKRNANWGALAKGLIERRNLRLNIAGQELEISGVQEAVEAAALAATASDKDLTEASQGNGVEGPDVSQIRREAVEAIMQKAATLGWFAGASGEALPPGLALRWQDDGSPDLVTVINRPRQGARARVLARALENLVSNRDRPHGDDFHRPPTRE